MKSIQVKEQCITVKAHTLPKGIRSEGSDSIDNADTNAQCKSQTEGSKTK